MRERRKDSGWREGEEENECFRNYQVNFMQTSEKPQKVKCELAALPSAEVHENKLHMWREKTHTCVYSFFKSNTKQLVRASICLKPSLKSSSRWRWIGFRDISGSGAAALWSFGTASPARLVTGWEWAAGGKWDPGRPGNRSSTQLHMQWHLVGFSPADET